MPRGGEGKYKHKVIEDKSHFDKRSFRVISLKPGVKMTIGCPEGEWSPSKKKCKVGTRAQKIMRLKKKSSKKRK